MGDLNHAMLMIIANEGLLAPGWLDQALKRDWADQRECHIGGGFLLIYRSEKDQVWFVRTLRQADLIRE